MIPTKPSMVVQLLVSFVIPLIILTRFSADSMLGPTKSFLLALLFPVVYELYNVRRLKKLSMLSVWAIVGVLLTGAVSLLGLSEGWLALRRGVPYLATGIVIAGSIVIKRPILNALLPQILDMDKITEAAQKKHKFEELQKKLNIAGYMLGIMLILIAVASYILTRVVIVSAAGSAGFNQEYAKLRLLSLPYNTLPLIVGVTIVITYLTQAIEKLTGLELDQLTKKK